ncbi:WD repeat-containing protein 53 [Boleophthalmus pectinirostris]|uniref:WD repeat-containing protein 53 n=1 Tax=Boleophthalmus pectinirostris TaxID=150288 RepID=UPI00242B1D3B|nr:WD repeat-containing protein 53 [Boleophthalmus pectinirostris]
MNVARQWCEGHTSPILCVGAASGPEGLIVSGSEGGQITVWNQEGVIVGNLQLAGEDDCTSVIFSPSAPAQLYVSHGETVSVVDYRNLKSSVEQFKGVGEEEINALALNETSSALAVADDSGAVRILDLPGGKVCRTLRRHTNICSSLAFRPQRPNNLVSVGLDMQVILWGLQKTRPLWTLNIQDILEEEEHHQQPGQLFNPPLAHCVTVSSCGNIVSCAAEDGRVHLIRIGSGSKLEQQGSVKAHSQGASQAHFVNFLSHPYWLISGGNDSHVALWDLSKHPVVEGKLKHQSAGNDGRRKKSKIKTKHKKKDRTAPLQEAEAQKDSCKENENAAETESVDSSKPKLKINHGEKVNWLCPAVLKGQPSVVVADQSSSLTIYPLITE